MQKKTSFLPWQINAGDWLTWNYSNTVEKQDSLHFLPTVIVGPSHTSWLNALCDYDVLKTIWYSLSEPSAKSCLVPCVPCPVELLLAVCRDQLTPDWGSADQPHKVCSKSHTADKEGVVAVGCQKDIQIMNNSIWWSMYFTDNITHYCLFAFLVWNHHEPMYCLHSMVFRMFWHWCSCNITSSITHTEY